MKKLLLGLWFLAFCLFKTQGVLAQSRNTFSCTWQPETNQCVENLSLNNCDIGFQSNPQVCTKITDESTCFHATDQPCVSSDLSALSWKCSQGSCHQCTTGENCPYLSYQACREGCTAPTPTPIPTSTPILLSESEAGGGGGGSGLDRYPGEGINFNELRDSIPGLRTVFKPGEASNVGGIISLVLPYLFVIAGLLLLFYLIYGGFHMMIAANDEKGLAEAKGKITNALVGFLLLFVSYWLVQILGHIFGITIF